MIPDLGKIWDSLTSGTNALTAILTVVSLALMPIVGVLGTVVLLFALFGDVGSALDTLLSALTTARSAMQASNWSTYYARANLLFPLSEGLTFVGIIFAMSVISAGIRMIKACIPTVS